MQVIFCFRIQQSNLNIYLSLLLIYYIIIAFTNQLHVIVRTFEEVQLKWEMQRDQQQQQKRFYLLFHNLGIGGWRVESFFVFFSLSFFSALFCI